MLDFFKNKKPEKINLIKSTSVYISDKFKHVIIAPNHENNAGIIYEQEICLTSTYPIDVTVLGNEVINSLNLYSIKDVNLRNSKKADWPAFNHSQSKSASLFENDYINIFIRSANDSNLILLIEGHPYKNSEITVNSSVSFYALTEEIARRIKNVYETCLTGKIP